MKRLGYLIEAPVSIWQMLLSYLPGPIGYGLRYRFWAKRLKYLGAKVLIDVGVYFQNPEFISIEDRCWIDRGVIILAGPDKSHRARRKLDNAEFQLECGTVLIGKGVHIGAYSVLSGMSGVNISSDCTLSSGVKIYSFSHHYRSDSAPWDKGVRFGSCADEKRQFMIEGPVFLGENVGVALNAVILPGVTIERDSFVAVNSVVSSSFGENSLISGNPAKRVGNRFEDS